MDALERLGYVDKMGEVLKHLSTLQQAMSRVVDGAGLVIDLYSRKRPFTMRISDEESALDGILSALQAVSMAEENIGRLRQLEAPLAEQLQAFLRLEVTLGHALDLIAAASEAGLHIGFEAQLSTSEFAARHARTKEHLRGLNHLIELMAEAPVSLSSQLDARFSAKNNEVQLKWPFDGGKQPAALRIYRQINLDGAREVLINTSVCEGLSAADARQKVFEATAELTPREELLQEIAPGLTSYVDKMDDGPIAPPLYRVAPVSVFGVEGKGAVTRLKMLFATLEGAGGVVAKSMAPSPESSDFYHNYDMVKVEWRLSESDITTDEEKMEWAALVQAPVVAAYRVLRIVNNEVVAEARVAAGRTELLDRVSQAELSAGVIYRVEVEGSDGTLVSMPAACSESSSVSLELDEDLLLARAGTLPAGSLDHPVFKHKEQLLSDPVLLGEAQKEFDKLSDEQKAQSQADFWAFLPLHRQIELSENWAALLSPKERAAVSAKAPLLWESEDNQWLRAALFLTTQPTWLSEEIERLWNLSSPDERAEVLSYWQKRLLVFAEKASSGTGASIPESVVDAARKVAPVVQWVRSKDAWEQERILSFWDQLSLLEQGEAFRSWYSTQPRLVQQALHWAPFSLQGPVESLSMPKPFPAKLTPDLLATRWWISLPAAERVTELRAVLGFSVQKITSLRYMLRPLDAALGFRLSGFTLVFLTSLIAFGLLLRGVVMGRRPKTN